MCQKIVCWKTVRQKPHQPQKQSCQIVHSCPLVQSGRRLWFTLSGAFPVLFQCFMGKPQNTLGLFHLVSTFCWSVPPGVHLLLVQMPPYLRRWQSTFQSVPGIGVQFPQSRCALQKQWFEAILLVLNSSNQGINSCYQLLNFYWCKDLSFRQRAGRHLRIKIWKNEKENWENWNVEKIPG